MVCFNLFKWDKSKACRFTISREVVEPLSNWLWHLGINDVSRAHFVKRWLACQNDFVMGIEPEHLSRAILARNMILSITWLITKIIHVARFLVTQLTIATHTNTWRPRLVLLFDFSLLFSLRDISFRLQAKKIKVLTFPLQPERPEALGVESTTCGRHVEIQTSSIAQRLRSPWLRQSPQWTQSSLGPGCLPPWASYGKLLAGGMMSFNLPNSIKQHPVCGSLVKRISYFCWSLFSSCQMGPSFKYQLHNGLKNFLTLTIKHGRSIHSGSASSGILKHTIPLDPITKCQQTGNQNNQGLDCVPPDLLLFYICDHLALVLGDDDVGSSTDDSQLFLWYLQNWSTQNFDVQSNNQNNFCFWHLWLKAIGL